jgi:predicted nucleic acid-binding protein
VGSKRVFLDTNVVLDMLDNSRPNGDGIGELSKRLIIYEYVVVISEDMLSTIFYVHKDKRKTLEFLKVISKRWIISTFGKDVIKKAIDLSFENNLDLEDVLQYLCAKENGCDILITNDKKFYDCDIKRVTVKEFLNSV